MSKQSVLKSDFYLYTLLLGIKNGINYLELNIAYKNNYILILEKVFISEFVLCYCGPE
jgi:hypothetical protein